MEWIKVFFFFFFFFCVCVCVCVCVCFSQQRVVVNGVNSDWDPVVSVSHRAPFWSLAEPSMPSQVFN